MTKNDYRDLTWNTPEVDMLANEINALMAGRENGHCLGALLQLRIVAAVAEAERGPEEKYVEVLNHLFTEVVFIWGEAFALLARGRRAAH